MEGVFTRWLLPFNILNEILYQDGDIYFAGYVLSIFLMKFNIWHAGLPMVFRAKVFQYS